MSASISADAVAARKADIVLACGFRPFFLATAGWAVGAVVLWVAAMAGALPAWLSTIDLAWHQHEMMFGVFGAALAGFVLTAWPEWTKTGPLTGGALALLFGLWAVGRGAMLFDAQRIELVLLTAAFLPVLTVYAIATLARIHAWRLMSLVGLLAVLSLLAVFWQAGRVGLIAITPTDLALPSLLVYAALVTVASGRIVPIVSQLALSEDSARRMLRIEPSSSDVAAWVLVVLSAAIAFDVRSEIIAWIAMAAAAAQVHRLCEWHIGWSGRRPYIWPFHVASVMIAAAAAAIAVDRLGLPVPTSSLAHGLGMGGAALATLAVMTIAGLLHTGHPLQMPVGCVVALGLLAMASFARIAAPWLAGDLAKSAIDLAGSLWVLSFLLYLVTVGPKLIRPRIDGRPG